MAPVFYIIFIFSILYRYKSQLIFKACGIIMNDSIICQRNNNLYIEESAICHKGVFCNAPIKKGEVIECCPVIIFAESEIEFLKFTNIYNYYALQSKGHNGILPLGFGAIYNHASPSNAEYVFDAEKKTLTITSICNIEADVEITINYNGQFNDNTPVVFSKKDETYEFSVNLF